MVGPCLLFYIRTIPNPIFQQDNACSHAARVTLTHFENSLVNLLAWLPRFSDLSPIKHVYDIISLR